MSTATLSRKPTAQAVALKVVQPKSRFEAIRYLASVAGAVLRFNAAGNLVATTVNPQTVYTANGAITLRSGIHLIEKTSAAAMTVAAPSGQDGERLTIISNSDFAHVITFTGSTLLDGTTGANTTVTMAAFKGSAFTFVARGTKWLLESSSNVTSIVA